MTKPLLSFPSVGHGLGVSQHLLPGRLALGREQEPLLLGPSEGGHVVAGEAPDGVGVRVVEHDVEVLDGVDRLERRPVLEPEEL